MNSPDIKIMTKENSFASETKSSLVTKVPDKKSRRKDIPWSLGEDFLFFELHKLEQMNKWKKISLLLPYKKVTDLKNHFHNSIISTLRKLMSSKYPTELQEVMEIFYILDYFLLEISRVNGFSKEKKATILDHKKEHNIKCLILDGTISQKVIVRYTENLFNKLLCFKEVNKVLNEDLGTGSFVNCISRSMDFIRKIFGWIVAKQIAASRNLHSNDPHGMDKGIGIDFA